MNRDIAVVVFAYASSRPIYTPWHVENMRRMVSTYLSLPHRFVVVTDKVEDHLAAGLDAIPLWRAPRDEVLKPNWINCYARLGLFDKDIGGAIAPRILSIDLDAVIRDSIDDLFDGDDPFKILCMKDLRNVQGGLFRVDPGMVDPCPWDVMLRDEETHIFERSAGGIGSDQAIFSTLYYDRVRSGDVPHWSQDDGMSLNDFHSPWRIFFRTGHKKCWQEGMEERDEYLRQSDRTTVPDDLPFSRGDGIARKTIQRLNDRMTARRPTRG